MPIDKLQTDALSNTVTANITSLALGANVSVNTSAVVVGSGTILAGGVRLPSNFGVSSNTTNLLENRSGQLFFNGRRVDLGNEYSVSPAVYGYFLNGAIDISGTTSAIADRITFSTGATSASTISKLSTNRFGGAGISDCTTYGYALGGYTGSDVNTVNRTIFATSVTAVVAETLSAARRGIASVSDGSIYGYALGGAGYVATTDIVTFSTGTVGALSAANLSLSRRVDTGGLSDAATYGYVLGGYSGAVVSTADRITFSTRTTAASSVSNLSQSRWYVTGVSDGVTYGYSLGGDSSGASAYVATTDRTTFSTSATAAYTTGNLSSARGGASGVSDGATYGYVAGGHTTSGTVTTTDRITFSSGAAAAYTAAALSAARWLGHAFSDGAV